MTLSFLPWAMSGDEEQRAFSGADLTFISSNPLLRIPRAGL